MQEERHGLNSTRLIRSYNVISILQALYKVGSCSRVQLTELTRMSPSTVTRIVAQLLEKKIITEEGTGESSGGRRPIILKLNYDKLFIIGLQICRDKVILGISDLKGAIIKKTYMPHAPEPGALIREMIVKIELFLKNSGIDREYILGIGIAIPGIIQGDKRVLLHSLNLGWYHVDIVQALEGRFGLEVAIENDANAAALAELWFGDAKDTHSFIYLKTGTKRGVTHIRAGIIYERKLLSGSHGMAGEIGHIPIKLNGWSCRCGRNGCLETYLNPPDLTRRYQKETGNRFVDFSELFRRAENGEEKAGLILEEAISALSTTISFSSGLLDLDMVVIGGEWANIDVDVFIRLQKEFLNILKNCGSNKPFMVIRSKLGEEADLLGAVGLVIHRWFTPPI